MTKTDAREDFDEKESDESDVDEGWTEEGAAVESADSNADSDVDGNADSTGDAAGDGDDQALDELEAEELEMLTEDETAETIAVDEAAELRAIRRAEIAIEGDGTDARADDEFVCQNCFLVLKSSQLADKRKRICVDCAS